MSKTYGLFALPLLPLAFLPWTTPSKSMTTRISDDVRCEIRATPTASGVRLESVAMSKVPISGEYEFTVEKSGGGGTSSSSQSGDFELGSGEESLLS